MDYINEVSEYIEKAPENHREILTKLRDLIAAKSPEATEGFKWSRPVYGLEKDFCYLNYSQKHVNLGFFNFEKINDTQGLLEGTGKQMRHIKIKNLENLDEDYLGKMIQQAAEL